MLNFNEWLKDKVQVRVEVKEMVHGVEDAELRQNENSGGKNRHGDRGKQFVLHWWCCR